MKKIQKNKFLYLGLIFLCQTIYSQSIEELYVKMPDILNPTLTRQNRLEIIEYYKAKQSDSILNRFGNQAYLLSLDTINQRIKVKNTESSTFEMKVGFLEDSIPYVGIIRTICGPICQSTVEFYDTAWNVISLKFSIPKSIEWFDNTGIKSDELDERWVKKSVEVSFVSFCFEKGGDAIIAKNNGLEFLTELDRKLIKPFMLTKDFKYKLVGRTWVKEN